MHRLALDTLLQAKPAFCLALRDATSQGLAATQRGARHSKVTQKALSRLSHREGGFMRIKRQPNVSIKSAYERYTVQLVCAILAGVCVGGCANELKVPSDMVLWDRATQYIYAAARFPENPVVRAQAMESISQVMGPQESILLREGVKDEHPGVRFAACMALGQFADSDAVELVRPLVNDPDDSVRVSAYYALERMGDASYRVHWRDALVRNPDPIVRRNAALALGRLADKSALPLLRKVSADDNDDGVRIQALEAMAFLGDTRAVNRFIRDAYGGVGFRQPFALLTLGRVMGEGVILALKTRLNGAPYIEARLAAARGLGMQHYNDGLSLAMKSLTWNDPNTKLLDDPPESQVMRVRSMAALALGAIGDRKALGPLAKMMEEPEEASVQLAAATAILMILNSATDEAVVLQ